MPIEYSCSNCLTSIRVPDTAAGKQAQCPACNAVSNVPAATSASPFSDAPQGNPFEPSAHVTQTVKRPIGRIELAERGTRLVAVIVDGLATLVPIACMGAIGAAVASAADGEDVAEVVAVFCFVLGGIGSFAVAIYNMVLTANTGETIGKRMFRIRVVKESDGSPPGFVHGVLLRNWVMILLNNVPFVGLIDVLMIFGDKRQCLHDMIASTRVIKGRPVRMA